MHMFETSWRLGHRELQPRPDPEGASNDQQFQGLHTAADWKPDQGSGTTVLPSNRLVLI